MQYAPARLMFEPQSFYVRPCVTSCNFAVKFFESRSFTKFFYIRLCVTSCNFAVKFFEPRSFTKFHEVFLYPTLCNFV
jgi:hypothetical protein